MKRLFILGNGFDKAHKIQSDYSDFGDFLESHHWPFFNNIMVAFQQDNHLWSNFEAILPECAVYIEESGLQMGHEMLDELDYDPCDDMSIGVWLKDQYEFIRQLPIVLRDWAEHIDINKEPLFEFHEDDCFFTFNYTDTVEKVYGQEDVLHIHGDVDTNDLLIMGHGDQRGIKIAKERILQSQSECLEYAESTYKAVLKYLESTLKDTDSIITAHKGWFDRLYQIDEIYVVGQSLGNVDMPYFKKIHESVRADTKWFLCHHNGVNADHIRKDNKLRELGITNIESIGQQELYRK